MNKMNQVRFGAVAAYAAFVVGGAGMFFERGSPAADAKPAVILEFLEKYHAELMKQSFLLILSCGLFMFFFAGLASFLKRAEGKGGMFSSLAFGAGLVHVCLQIMLQAVQIAMATAVASDPASALTLSMLTYPISTVSFIAYSVMLASVAAASIVTHALPLWVGIFSAVLSAVCLSMLLGIIIEDSIFTPGRPMTYIAYLLTPIWTLTVATYMIVRSGKYRTSDISQ